MFSRCMVGSQLLLLYAPGTGPLNKPFFLIDSQYLSVLKMSLSLSHILQVRPQEK